MESRVFEDESQNYTIITALFNQKQSSLFCDVIMKVCGKEMYAHSNILAAASPYFNTFLGQDIPRQFSQRLPQIIEIQIEGNEPDSLYEEAVTNVVDFIYSGNLEIKYSNVNQVLEIAKIMQMDNVVGFCEQFLKEISDAATANTESASVEPSPVETRTEEPPESTTLVDSGVQETKTDSHDHKDLQSILIDPAELAASDIPVEDRENQEAIETAVEKPTPKSKEKQIKPKRKYTKKQPTVKQETPEVIKDEVIQYMSSGRPKRKSAINNSFISGGLKRRRQVQTKKEMPKEEEEAVEGDENEEKDDGEIPEMRDGLKIYNCPYCDYATTNMYHLRRHQSKHGGFKYSCDKCDFFAMKLKVLTVHQREHKHLENQCSFCDHRAESYEDLQEHLQRHTGDMPFFCPVCEIRFKTRTQMNLHLPKHSDEKPFVCDICSMGFKWKHALKNHQVVHSSEKSHLCDVCGYATAHKSQLKAHRLIHTGETYKCNHPGCGFQATKRQNLKYHMLTHTREKPHQCEVCGQSFSLVKNMRRHMLLHTQTKPHCCTQCDFASTRFDKLKEHLLKQHGAGEPPSKRKGLGCMGNSTMKNVVKKLSYETIMAQIQVGDNSQVQTVIINEPNAEGGLQQVQVQSVSAESAEHILQQAGQQVGEEHIAVAVPVSMMSGQQSIVIPQVHAVDGGMSDSNQQEQTLQYQEVILPPGYTVATYVSQ